MEAAGVMMPLINLTCHYGIPAKYEDVVVVETRATKLSAAKMVLYYEVKRKATVFYLEAEQRSTVLLIQKPLSR